MAASGWLDFRLLSRRAVAIGHPYAELLSVRPPSGR
jgi:hypothetical protein